MSLLTLLLVGNAVAWVQAWSMTHYAASGERTPKPEELTLSQKVWAVATGVTVPRPHNTHTPAGAGLKFEVHTIPVSNGEALEAWYVPQVEPRVLVIMFPGYAESKESLLPAASALHQMGSDLLLVDFRGAGGSTGSDTSLGAREAADVKVAAAYAAIAWPGRPLVLFGVSMGAAAVLRASAVEGVSPAALIVESPFNNLLSTVENRFSATGLPSFPAAPLLVFWGSVQHGFNGFTHNPEEYACSVHCPVLLMSGDLDPRVTPAQASGIFTSLAGRKEFVSFAGAGHESLIASDSRLWKVRVGRFLDQLAP